jgi:hypothetical protein
MITVCGPDIDHTLAGQRLHINHTWQGAFGYRASVTATAAVLLDGGIATLLEGGMAVLVVNASGKQGVPVCKHGVCSLTGTTLTR